MKKITFIIVAIFAFCLSAKAATESYKRSNFKVKKLAVTMIEPTKAAEGTPWLWRHGSQGAISPLDSTLLSSGFHLVYSSGSISSANQLYNSMVEDYGLSSKVTLDSFDWAADNSDKVAAISVEKLDSYHPTLAKNLVPIIYSSSDASTKANADKYRTAGGLVEQVVEGSNSKEAIHDFIMRNQIGFQSLQHITRRGDLNNSYLKFTKEKKGCVAFLGGSITAMTGWRDMVKEDLQQRFPDTKFDFIEVGIGSQGSIPHSFRLVNDILSKATPDLLFFEAAVNDQELRYNYVDHIRGVEGVLSHARKAAPNMDIVMLHFMHNLFIPIIERGLQPQVIMNHEAVANYYCVPSINLAQEVTTRMSKGEFNWKEFGGIHPRWNGHKFYASAISRLFDIEWSGDVASKTAKQHRIEEKLIDNFSYDKGEFIDIHSITDKKGWRIVENWTPEPQPKASTRVGFVKVPMLVADDAGSTLTLNFTGRAIGIFCVAGPKSCVLEYSVDGAPYKEFNTMDRYSKSIYLPRVYLFESELEPTNHTLHLRVAKGETTQCIIRDFVVNR